MSTPQARRGNTRQRIQDVALELFAEQGYDKTSLREIAERLEVTKAALYYHFKSKEDIVISVFQDVTRPIDELIAWAEGQPRTLETKQRLISEYSECLRSAGPFFHFMHQNQATVRELTIGESFRQRLLTLSGFLKEPDAELVDQVRCITALFALQAHLFAAQSLEGDPEDKRRAFLEVATELVTAANPPSRRPVRPDSAQT
ncbi:TetR/AcrR family transcriptional regulator [Streptomyces sp. NPDC001339]|uniref:TetR/AcrR family transcriptional regulator n=1 Tax=Streptomyces sp. NPDC001339 TaxID=3364563 RepID=UPI0036971CEE